MVKKGVSEKGKSSGENALEIKRMSSKQQQLNKKDQ